jgi:hypothetical protein
MVNLSALKNPLVVQGIPADTPGVTVVEHEQPHESFLVPTPATTTVPPPPPSDQQANLFAALPAGWSTATSPEDGRIYYWEKATGRTSWTHPLAVPPTQTPQQSPLPPPNDQPQTSSNFWSGMNDYRQTSRNFLGGMNMTRSQANPNMNVTRSEYHDTPWNSSRRAENHQCYAVTALVLCFPIGAFAMYHSIQVDRSWEQSKFGDAVNHSRQASNFACFGTFIGICFWIYWFLFADGKFDWPDFNFD